MFKSWGILNKKLLNRRIRFISPTCCYFLDQRLLLKSLVHVHFSFWKLVKRFLRCSLTRVLLSQNVKSLRSIDMSQIETSLHHSLLRNCWLWVLQELYKKTKWNLQHNITGEFVVIRKDIQLQSTGYLPSMDIISRSTFTQMFTIITSYILT